MNLHDQLLVIYVVAFLTNFLATSQSIPQSRTTDGYNYFQSSREITEDCVDDKSYKFENKAGKPNKGCKWVSRKPSRIKNYCEWKPKVTNNNSKSMIKFFCKETCSNYLRQCQVPTSSPTSVPSDNHSGPQKWSNDYGYGYNGAGGWRVEKHPRFLADVNGDGMADIIGFANDGVMVSYSNGTGFTPPELKIAGVYGYNAGGWRVEKHPRFLADVNGDGMADVVGFANAGVRVSYSNGTGFTPPELKIAGAYGYGYNAGGWRVEKHPRFLADVNGDGTADIVGFANDGVYVSIDDMSS